MTDDETHENEDVEVTATPNQPDGINSTDSLGINDIVNETQITSGWPLSEETLRSAVNALFDGAKRYNQSRLPEVSQVEKDDDDCPNGVTEPLLENPLGEDLGFYVQFTFKFPPHRELLRPVSM